MSRNKITFANYFDMWEMCMVKKKNPKTQTPICSVACEMLPSE